MEISILLWFQNVVRQPWLTLIMQFTSFLGKAGWFFVLASLLFCCFKKTRKLGIMMSVSIILMFISTNLVLKPLVARPRPYITHADVLNLVGVPETDLSFPSGHTAVAVAWCSAIWLSSNNKPLKVSALLLSILMGISRLYLGYHYPTDVLGAAIFGVLSAYAARFVVRKYIYPKLKD